ncbi:MAG: diguanylate cyclase [Spirochaetales bacterium]|nr:MAG: diguanylate cyclase [Spirochaetales bacterium]
MEHPGPPRGSVRVTARVLIVDDSAENLRALETVVLGLGHRVVRATSGEEAITVVESHDVDIVLLNSTMPGLDGYQTCARIVGLGWVPVIFVTAESNPQSVARGFAAGAVDYITIPFQPSEVAARVNQQVKLQAYQRDLRETNHKLEIANRELSRALAEVERLAMTDPLTGLLNRRAMTERLHEEERRAARYKSTFSFLMGDLDHFKRINDEHGHECGDQVLVSAVGVLRDGVRGEDVIARWGGEEFLIMLPQTHLDGAIATAEKLRSTMEGAITPCGSDRLGVTITFGVAEFQPEAGIDASIGRADRALYRGKGRGRNQVVADVPGPG